MSEWLHSTLPNGTPTMYRQYTEPELWKVWRTPVGQGQRQARKRGRYCVVIGCDQATAARLANAFLRVFACPSCTHYNGGTLSMYCGDAGPGIASLMETVRGLH